MLSFGMNYPSDLTDAQWALIVELTARPDPRGAVRRHPMREIINAILYVNKTGCQWRLLPVNFAPWATVYDHFRRFRQRGAWEAMMLRLNGKVREKRGRASGPSYLIIDSQSVKSAAEGPERGFHGGKKIKGRSRQIAVDTQGLIWAVHVHAANKADTMEGCALADLAMENAPTVRAWCADAGYRGTFVDYMEKEKKMPVHISERIRDGFAVLPRRWVVERTFAWGNGQRRLSKDYEKNTLHSEAMIQISAVARNLRALAA
jgi:putative transposase